MKLGCVVMAAGASVRYGENKLLETLEGKSLLARTLEAVPRDVFSAAVVVSRGQGLTLAKRMGFTCRENTQPELGVSLTIRLGLSAMTDCDGVLFTVADQPFLTEETFRRVAEAFLRHPEGIVAAAHNGKRGNPCLFAARFFPELLALTGDVGGSAVIRAHPEAVHLCQVPARELLDCDTRQALAAARRSSLR